MFENDIDKHLFGIYTGINRNKCSVQEQCTNERGEEQMKQSGHRYAMKQTRKIRMHTFTAVAAAIVLILIITVFFTGRQAKAGDLDQNTNAGKYYTSYEVQSGDTLWTIAEAYSSGSNQSVKAYVEEVCRINHLSDANQIYAGSRICIPYYK